jgi:hypothetical protein
LPNGLRKVCIDTGYGIVYDYMDVKLLIFLYGAVYGQLIAITLFYLWKIVKPGKLGDAGSRLFEPCNLFPKIL